MFSKNTSNVITVIKAITVRVNTCEYTHDLHVVDE